MISLFEIETACRELERCATIGLKDALIWTAPPEDRAYSGKAYDRFWAAAQELKMPLSLHTLTGRTKAAQQDESDIGELYARMVSERSGAPRNSQETRSTRQTSSPVQRSD
jgi:predicted TIM-barrel fold metal-dependent hydrolase